MWRAEYGRYYWTVDIVNKVVERHGDIYMDRSNENHKIGNYFKTEEEATIALNKLKEIFVGSREG